MIYGYRVHDDVLPQLLREHSGRAREGGAHIDGAGFFTIFTKILLPVSLPIFMVCPIWQFTQIWNDFLFGISCSRAWIPCRSPSR
ncbi:MAG: ABC transporter, permease protein 2 (cluster 1, maltose/g3p/polyamine/iron) [uncultured Caballeronia sp.]|nr:MAG: ABC transporter, permease protein 2 (cluster 1, maltose/g3p/polyamine/iron) [uncultured Caballeronia sp.]